MQRYRHDDPYERHLESPHRHTGHGLGSQQQSRSVSPYYDDASRQRPPNFGVRDYDDYSRPVPTHNGHGRPIPPAHSQAGYGESGSSAALDDFTQSSTEAGFAYDVTNYSTPDEARRTNGRIPPPPSRAFNFEAPRQPYSPYAGGAGYPYDPYTARPPNPMDQDSASSLNPFGTTPTTHSPSRSLNSFGQPESFGDDHYQSCSSNPRHAGVDLGLVDPDNIEDDGDDGLTYARRPQRSSFFSGPNLEKSGRGKLGKPGIGLAAGAGTGAAGLEGLANKQVGTSRALDVGASQEKPSAWLSKQRGRSKKCKWITIVIVFLLIVGAIVGGVVGSLVAVSKNKSDKTAADDTKTNGDLDINSDEIKALLNNADLHKVFPGMDYTPYNTQYPDCLENPPSQNNVTRDVAVLSQLTNKLRLYGTDCNQTEMVLHALKKLKMDKDIKVWLGVWQDKNETTNARQLEQMWKILEKYGSDPFEGIIVANEVLFRKEMTITSLASVLDDVRKKLSAKSINLLVAMSDLGNDWTTELAKDSDYIMANIHPFFAGVSAETAASWTWSFWEGQDGQFWKTDKNKNIIAETGWPSAGGKNCGQSPTGTCQVGSVAGIKELNQFMQDWVCDALKNGTQYFWFEAFDEPWKIRFNEKGKEWEDKWGLMDINRNLKQGVKIPDCGGKTVS